MTIDSDSDNVKTGSNSEIWVNSFNEESAQAFRESLIKFSKMDKNMPIVVYIDSYGGAVDGLAKMIETMDEIPNIKVTVCLGKAMSAGAVLLSHGDVRFCGPHSRIMVHEVSSGTSGDVNDMYSDIAETKRLNEWFIGLLAKNCGIKGGYRELRKIIKDRDGRDMYMDAKQALSFGIVDAIGTPKITASTMYEIAAIPPKVGRTPVTQKNPDSKKSNNKGGNNVKAKRKQ